MSVSTNAIKFCWLSYFVRVFVILDGNVAFLLFPLSVGVETVASKSAPAPHCAPRHVLHASAPTHASTRNTACTRRTPPHLFRSNACTRAGDADADAARRRRVRARVALAFRRYQATLRRRTLRRARTRARLSHRTRWRRIVGGRSPGAIGHRGAHARGPRRRVRNKRQQTSRGAHEHGWDVQSARAREARARYKP